MKQLLILFLLILCYTVFSQDDRYYEYVDFKLYNSEGESIKNASILVDGKTVPFDSSRHSYLLIDSIRMFFNIEVFCDGYETISYSRENLEGSGTSFFRGFFYLKRPFENFFYVNNWLKMPYQPYSNKLLVILNSREFPRDDSLQIRFENKIKQQGLKINYTFKEQPVDPIENWKYMSYFGLYDRLIIEKEDGSDFENDYCAELAYMRSLDEVEVAGPLICFRDQYNIITYGHKISLYEFGIDLQSEHAKERSKLN